MAALNNNSINIYFRCLPDIVEERIHEMEKRFGKKNWYISKKKYGKLGKLYERHLEVMTKITEGDERENGKNHYLVH